MKNMKHLANILKVMREEQPDETRTRGSKGSAIGRIKGIEVERRAYLTPQMSGVMNNQQYFSTGNGRYPIMS